MEIPFDKQEESCRSLCLLELSFLLQTKPHIVVGCFLLFALWRGGGGAHYPVPKYINHTEFYGDSALAWLAFSQIS